MNNYFSHISRLFSGMRKWDRFIAWFILSILLWWIFLISVFASDQWFVTSYYLNVRNSGKYGAPIIATLKRGDSVTVLSSLKNGWKKIELSNGTIGYVNSRYLSSREPIINVSIGKMYKVSVGNAFVRGDTLQTKVAVVRKDDSLEAVDDGLYQGKWLRVRIVSSSAKRYDNRIGYISKELVEAVKAVAYELPDEEGSWIQDFDIVNMISVSGTADVGAGALTPINKNTEM